MIDSQGVGGSTMMVKRHRLLEGGHIQDPLWFLWFFFFGVLALNIQFIRTLFLNFMEIRNFLDFSG